MWGEIKIFTGNANISMARDVASYLGVPMGDALVNTFSDGEIQVQINENVRGMDVFVVQSVSHPVNHNLMELLIMIDAFKRASALRVTAVIPYYPYARQDKKVQPRVPITAKLVADLITTAGAHRVLTVDLHAEQIQGFFNIPVDNLYAAPILHDYVSGRNLDGLVVVSPDAGGVARARAFAKRLNASLAIIDKRRPAPNVAKVMNIIGEVQGRDVVLLDDLVDTAGTLIESAAALRNAGARRILAACSHAILSGSATERINNSAVDELIATNTIVLDHKKEMCPRLTILSVAPLLGEAIRRIHEEASISSLFV